MKRYGRPVGWRHESYRHYLAAKGIKTGKLMKWSIPKGKRILWMSPDEYVQRTGRGKSVEEFQRLPYAGKIYDKELDKVVPVELFAERVRRGEVGEIEAPMVLGRGPLAEQEGLHRAAVAKLVGEEKIPVLVEDSEKARAKEVFEEFMKRRFPSANSTYKKEWELRFASGVPTQWMDAKSLKAYNNVLREKGLAEDYEPI